LILDTMKSQSAEMNRSMQAIAELLASQDNNPNPNPPKESPSLMFSNKDFVEMNNLTLPKDLHNWRTLHVQAWLAYKLELPMYIDAFKVQN